MKKASPSAMRSGVQSVWLLSREIDAVLMRMLQRCVRFCTSPPHSSIAGESFQFTALVEREEAGVSNTGRPWASPTERKGSLEACVHVQSTSLGGGLAPLQLDDDYLPVQAAPEQSKCDLNIRNTCM